MTKITHGRARTGTLSTLLLGSVVSRVLNLATMPVLLIK
ncbi:MAG: universal stress protein [Nitrosomonadales bacterium]